jgi:hypothetical protein
MTTDIELKELKDLISANHNAVTQQIAVGFAQVDTKFAQVDTKISDLRGEMNTRLAEMKGDLNIVKQPIEFWDFVKRSVAASLTVTVVGGLLLAAWKLAIFRTI